MPNLTILSRDAEEYAQHITSAALPGLKIEMVTSDPGRVSAAEAELLLAEPDLAVNIIAQCQELKWLQSTWAGNAPLINAPNRDYVLTAVRGIFETRIREYVFAYLLYFSRQLDQLHPRASASIVDVNPLWRPPSIGTLAGKTLGIFGAGSMAGPLVSTGHTFGMTVHGLNTRGSSDDAYDKMFTLADVEAFTASVDYLVCLLPETAQTKAVVDEKFLAKLQPHVVLINAGRGSSIDDQALLQALDEERLRAAVLDVFVQEPLPDEHPFWAHPRVWVTHHSAAYSEPSAVSEVFIQNYHRWIKGDPLDHVIDFERGY